MSELRQDPVTKEWIILAPERAKRPQEMLHAKSVFKPTPKKDCVFCNLKETGNWPPLLTYPEKGEWTALCIPNKFPSITHTQPGCGVVVQEGLLTRYSAVGYHDLFVTRDHNAKFEDLSASAAADLLLLMQARVKQVSQDKCVKFVSLFHNRGTSVGASVYHPHYQMLSLPVIPPLAKTAYETTHKYFKETGRSLHEDITAQEIKDGTRVICERGNAIAYAPYAPWRSFEVRVISKSHQPFFEEESEGNIKHFAVCLQEALSRMGKYLNNPDLNFYIHTAPLTSRSSYKGYHWHLEIVPNATSPFGGFEYGTGMKINTVTPEFAAKVLRGKVKVG
jgi:UDPglucose--hexose-1-phosphate uridylyltransferase